jgi:hypothetical protein
VTFETSETPQIGRLPNYNVIVPDSGQYRIRVSPAR